MSDKIKQEDLDNPNYSTWMYKKTDGVIIGEVFSKDLEKLMEDGWKLSPSDCNEEIKPVKKTRKKKGTKANGDS